MFSVLGAVTGAFSMYSAVQANKAADARAAQANFENAMAADRARRKAEKDAKERKEELLKRFKVKSSKIKDTSQEVFRATANKLTNLDMQMNKARSATDNALATKHLSGRLADRLRATQAIQGSMAKGTVVQASEASLKSIGDKLETLAADTEAQELNLDIDLSNSIEAANNDEIRGYTFSRSTGDLGVMSSTLSGVESGIRLGGML